MLKINKNLPRIKLKIEGKMLYAFYAISYEFKECGKMGGFFQTINHKEEKNFKLNDSDFLCVYKGINRALNGHRYPNKSGGEYMNLSKLKLYFEDEHINQRNCKIPIK